MARLPESIPLRLTLPLTLLSGKGVETSRTDTRAQSDPATGQVSEQVGEQVKPRAQSRAQSGQVAGQVTRQVTGQVAEWIIHALDACATPQKSSDIQKIVGIKHRETFQRNYLDQLLEAKLIERTIPEKPNSRLQKYRLTEKGKSLIHPS